MRHTDHRNRSVSHSANSRPPDVRIPLEHQLATEIEKAAGKFRRDVTTSVARIDELVTRLTGASLNIGEELGAVPFTRQVALISREILLPRGIIVIPTATDGSVSVIRGKVLPHTASKFEWLGERIELHQAELFQRACLVPSLAIGNCGLVFPDSVARLQNGLVFRTEHAATSPDPLENAIAKWLGIASGGELPVPRDFFINFSSAVSRRMAWQNVQMEKKGSDLTMLDQRGAMSLYKPGSNLERAFKAFRCAYGEDLLPITAIGTAATLGAAFDLIRAARVRGDHAQAAAIGLWRIQYACERAGHHEESHPIAVRASAFGEQLFMQILAPHVCSDFSGEISNFARAFPTDPKAASDLIYRIYRSIVCEGLHGHTEQELRV